MFEGSNRHFDQTLCMGLSITDEDIDSLCQSMKEQTVKNANNEVLSNHLNHCVKHAINEHDADKKIDEVIKLLTKL